MVHAEDKEEKEDEYESMQNLGCLTTRVCCAEGLVNLLDCRGYSLRVEMYSTVTKSRVKKTDVRQHTSKQDR